MLGLKNTSVVHNELSNAVESQSTGLDNNKTRLTQ